MHPDQLGIIVDRLFANTIRSPGPAVYKVIISLEAEKVFIWLK